MNSEQKHFENQWRKVFEDASMKPPARLWDSIEAELDKDRLSRDDFFEAMSSEQHHFEKQWQNVFADASVKPSPQIWNNIEEELDKDRRRPVFFLLRPSYLVGGIAALLLMIWGGVVLINKPPDPQREHSVIAEKKSDSNSRSSELANSKDLDAKKYSTNPINVNKDSKELIAKNSEKVDLMNNRNVIASLQLEREEGGVMLDGQKLIDDLNTQNNNVVVNQNTTNSNNSQITDNQLLITQNSENNRNLLNANLLNSKGFEQYKNRFQPRKYLIYESSEIEEEIIAQNESKFWVGVQSGVSPFNPNLNLGNIQTSASAQAAEFAKSANQITINATPTNPNTTATDRNFITVGMPKNQIRSGIATNFGFAAGYQLNKKWSIESGLRYFNGNSNLFSNTYSINETTGQVNAYFADYVANKSAGTIVADAEFYNNRYQYLMIPMQAGYQIPVRKNLNMSLLAGFSTDIFLQNVISSAGSFVSESKVNHGVYRTLNLSGLGGIRANYLLNKHLQANMGFNYQQAIFSGFKADNLNMRYRLFGLQYGLNYRF